MVLVRWIMLEGFYMLCLMIIVQYAKYGVRVGSRPRLLQLMLGLVRWVVVHLRRVSVLL